MSLAADRRGRQSTGGSGERTAYLFFGRSLDGSQCAVVSAAVSRVEAGTPLADQGTRHAASAQEPRALAIGVGALGFPLEEADATQRVLLVSCGQILVPITVRGQLASRDVSADEVFLLPSRSFPSCLFSALIDSAEYGRALLLDPHRLARFFAQHETASSAAATSTP